jgi:hypothetical protein
MKEVSMWPFSEMSLSTASLVGTIANWGLLVSLLAGLFSTFIIVKTTDVKEEHWEHARQESDERIAQLNKGAARLSAEAETAKGEIAKANQGAAEANARAAEAKLELEKFKAPRLLDVGQQARILEEATAFTGIRFDVSALPGDPEALNFAVQIALVLEAARWSWIEFNHPTGPLMTVYDLPGRPNMGQGGAWGVVVQTHADHADQFGPAATALAEALEAEGFIAAAAANPPESIPNHDTVHIIVGKKI